mmetsp:Transcript_13476/g.24163  ORF Transcript_13476/g.24163 Transcript_13476/m.24163 type:complete len:189 (-) Transcript_13476:247-813(-)
MKSLVCVDYGDSDSSSSCVNSGSFKVNQSSPRMKTKHHKQSHVSTHSREQSNSILIHNQSHVLHDESQSIPKFQDGHRKQENIQTDMYSMPREFARELTQNGIQIEAQVGNACGPVSKYEIEQAKKRQDSASRSAQLKRMTQPHSKIAKSRHQIGTLVADLVAKQPEIEQKRAKQVSSKRSARAKYGW